MQWIPGIKKWKLQTKIFLIVPISDVNYVKKEY